MVLRLGRRVDSRLYTALSINVTLRQLPAKSMERDLRQQIIAVKWQLVEATRRAAIAEATLARNGLSSFETAESA